MRNCQRCGSDMLAEPYDEFGTRGQRWTCICCGESRDQIEYERYATLTPAQRAALMMPGRAGRPRKVVRA